nr:GNAT family N-acetyltransferase [Mycobacteroides sp. CBMA 326]
MLRRPMLSDGPSWRETNRMYADRLRAAFDCDGVDWDAAHSHVSWIDTWRKALSDNKAGVSYFIVRIDGGRQRIVGHMSVAGVHARTGCAELSSWAVGIPSQLTQWAQACVVLDAFERHSRPHVIAPIAVSNHAPAKLARSLGMWTIQQQRQLRHYGGVLADHDIWILVNDADARAKLASIVAEIPEDTATAVPRREPLRSLQQAVVIPRYLVRIARSTVRAARTKAPDVGTPIPVGSASGEEVLLVPTRGTGGRYEVLIDGARVGHIEVAVDVGTSTAELLPQLAPTLPRETGSAVVVGLAIRLAEHHGATRRTVVTTGTNDTDIAGALAEAGFVHEGSAPPSPGDDLEERQMWTAFRDL